MQHRAQLKASSSQTETLAPVHKTDSATQTSHTSSREEDETPTTDSTGAGSSSDQATVARVKGQLEAGGIGASSGEAGASKSEGQEGSVEAERSKQTLLQRLRELDGQKSAPGSKPLEPHPLVPHPPAASQPQTTAVNSSLPQT